MSPYRWGTCFKKVITHTQSGNNKVVNCGNKGQLTKDNLVYLAGVQQGYVDGVLHWKMMQCCEMIVAPDDIDTMAQAKLFIMDMTLMDIANQAARMGYKWPRGCNGKTGENFIRVGDKWRADRGPR